MTAATTRSGRIVRPYDHVSLYTFSDVYLILQLAYRLPWRLGRTLWLFGQIRALRHYSSAASLHGVYFRFEGFCYFGSFLSARHLHPQIPVVPRPLRLFCDGQRIICCTAASCCGGREARSCASHRLWCEFDVIVKYCEIAASTCRACFSYLASFAPSCWSWALSSMTPKHPRGRVQPRLALQRQHQEPDWQDSSERV